MTRYQLSLHAENLKAQGWWRRVPSPYAVVETASQHRGTSTRQQRTRTETVLRSANPDWTKCLFVEASAGVQTPVKITIYDEVPHGENVQLMELDFGDAYEIFRERGREKCVTGPGGCKVYASMEESIKGTATGTCQLWLRGLDIRNIEAGLLGLGRTDPFFELSKKMVDHSVGVTRWNVTHRSEHIENHLNPYWDPFSVDVEELCFGDLDWPLRITVLDHQQNGRHRVIGYCDVTLNILTQNVGIKGNADRDKALELIKEKEAKDGEKTRRCGLICVVRATIDVT